MEEFGRVMVRETWHKSEEPLGDYRLGILIDKKNFNRVFMIDEGKIVIFAEPQFRKVKKK